MNKIYYILIIIIFSFHPVFSQENLDKKHLYKASRLAFDNENFQTALGYLLQYDSLYPGDYEISYRIGACYLNSEFQKTKAIPYIEKSIKTNKKNLPSITFKDLAHLYHLNYQLDKSEEMYQQYLLMEPADKEEINYLLKSVKKAKELISDSLKFRIENVGYPINTEQNEVMPQVSADESVMFFQDKESRKIFLSRFKKDQWGQKIKLDIPNLSNYQIVNFAGISPDGEQIFVQLGDSNNTDLYYGQNFLKTCNQLVLFNKNINSPYNEANISMSPDGNTLYFSSDRPEGYGGYDIYVSRKDKYGNWDKAQNLGPIINTKHNELYPFIHPSLKSLFFSSNGHETIGGFDIFEAQKKDSIWNNVLNIGYPINTAYDDISYSVTAKGNAAYLSSTRNDKTIHFDIYKVHLKESIPLTLVKGRILAGNPPKPIGAEIKVIDKLTQEPLKYIYNPNPQTGQYLLIFPPGKDYDMIVKAKGYNPYVINIYIPNQSYFYENFQEIILNPIQVNTLGQTIGEEIKVKNTFFDIYQTQKRDSAYSSVPKNYDKLLEIIEELITKTDTLGLNAINKYSKYLEENSSKPEAINENKDYDKLFALVEEAIESTDSITLKILDNEAIPNISYQNKYFYNIDRTKEEFDTVIIASDTIYAVKMNNNNAKKTTPRNKTNLAFNTVTGLSIHFKKNNSEIDERYNQSLTELVQLSISNPNLYIKIVGYANKQENPQIAITRASAIRAFLIERNLSVEKTKTIATIDSTKTLKKGQYANIVVFESKEPLYSKGEFSTVVQLTQAGSNVQEDYQDIVIAQEVTNSIIYKVQIASGGNYLTEGDAFFRDEQIYIYKSGSLYKYVIGNFDTSGKAFREQLRLIEKGFKGAFVVKFRNGVKID